MPVKNAFRNEEKETPCCSGAALAPLSDETGDTWLTFSQENKYKIKRAFAEDYLAFKPELVFREWFSINGGEKFGYSRLGYFISDMFFQYQIENLGESKAVTAWKEKGFEDLVKHWLLHDK